MGTQTTMPCAQAEDSGLLGPLQAPNWVKVCLISTVVFLPVSIVPRVENGGWRRVERGGGGEGSGEGSWPMAALNGAIRDFCNLLTTPRTESNIYTEVARAQSGVNHVQHIERLSRATFRDSVCHMVGRENSAIQFDSAEIAFILALFNLLNH